MSEGVRDFDCFFVSDFDLYKQEIEKLQRKHRETSLFSHLEELLREKSSEATEKAEDQPG